MTPTKYPQNLHPPQKYFFFLKTPKNIEIQNFEPQKIARVYVCVKISEYNTPPPSLGWSYPEFQNNKSTLSDPMFTVPTPVAKIR